MLRCHVVVAVVAAMVILANGCVSRDTTEGPAPVAQSREALTSGYTVQTTTGTYANLTASTVIFDGNTGSFDDQWRDIPIGFTFDLFDRSYTQVRVSSNGILTFGDSNGSSWPANAAVPGAGAPQAFVAPWWDNLTIGPNSGTPDEVSYQVTGGAPNRVFTVEYLSVTTAGSDASNVDFMNFQARLYETTGVIEILYGTSDVYAGTPPARSASAGIEDRTGMKGYTALACTPSCTLAQFPASGTMVRFIPAIEPVVARVEHAAALMTDGTVLIAGGSATLTAELYSVRSPGFSLTGDLTVARSQHTATTLTDGNVLVAGGTGGGDALKSTDLYSRAAKAFKPGPEMKENRQGHTATLLRDGTVLIVGGLKDFTTYHASGEIYDPVAGTTTLLASTLADKRAYHTATMMADGRVLIAGGYNGTATLSTAAIYDPKVRTFTATANAMGTARRQHTATHLLSGMVLIAGGRGDAGALNTSEVFEPLLGTWTPRGNLGAARYMHTATLLLDGSVLVTGGFSGAAALVSTEVFSSSGINWAAGANLSEARYEHTATMLPSQRILIYGGAGATGTALKTAEIITAVGTPSAIIKPVVTNAPAIAIPGDTLKITGVGIRGPAEGSGGGTQSSAGDPTNVSLNGPGGARYLFAHDFTSTEVLADTPCALALGAYTLQVETLGFASDARNITIDGTAQGQPCTCNEACQSHPPNAACYLNVGACVNGACAYTARPQGTTCNDGQACTKTDQCDGLGTCAGTAYTCTPTQCQWSSVCNGNGGCTVSNKAAATPCNDQDACTDTDACDGQGRCLGTPRICNAPNTPSCVNGTTSRVGNPQGTCAAGTCAYTYNDINCAPGTCNGATGLCTNPCNGVTCTTPPNTVCFTSPGACANGACTYPQMGAGYVCNDGKACTTGDACNAAGICVGLQAPVGAQCDDGNLCSKGDSCDLAGTCAGGAYTCPAPTECQQAVACDGLGGCDVTDKPDTDPCTTDNIACTTDRCDGWGICTHTVANGYCLIAGQCVTAGTKEPGQSCRGCDPVKSTNAWSNLNTGTVCDDGNACTSADQCNAAGLCAGTAYACPSPTFCQVSVTCDGTGSCNAVAKPSGTLCSDGNACTSGDQCNGAGACIATPYACTPGACDSSASCDGVGGCTYVRKAPGAPCDDGDPCSYSDSCSAGGACTGTVFTCPAPTECQASVACNGVGGCAAANKGAGEPCTSDGLSCTTDACDGAGQCAHPVVAGSCLIGGACYAAGAPDPSNGCRVCDPTASTVAWTSLGSGDSCDDSDPCTSGDTCAAGVCAGTAYTCPAATDCQISAVCDGIGGCTVVEKQDGTPCTADADLCTTDECKTGVCIHVAIPRGGACDDGDPCTDSDKCDSLGVCKGTAIPSCTPTDGGTEDGAVDAGNPDAGDIDGGSGDAGTDDAGKIDAGHPDGGKTDGGKTDGGKQGDAGPGGDGGEHLTTDTGTAEQTGASAVGGGCSCATVGIGE